MTLVELVIAILVLALLVPSTYLVARNLTQQSTNIGDTVVGVQQNQTAGRVLYPYLRAATTVLGPGAVSGAGSSGSGPTQLVATVNLGFDKANAIINHATLVSTLVPPAAPGMDATLVTTITPAQGQSHAIGTYYAEPVASGGSIFTYYYYNGGQCPGTTTTSTTSAVSGPSGCSSFTGVHSLSQLPPSIQYTQIVAVSINVTFLAGPNKPVLGYGGVHSSVFDTTVYLENATGTIAPETATSILTPGSILDGQPSVVQAQISPAPDGGTVSFSLQMSTGPPTTLCSGSVVLDGVATCSWTPSTYGSGTVTATYTGDTSYLPSTSTATAITIDVTTQLAITSVLPYNDNFKINASVSDSVGQSIPTGQTVTFAYSECSGSTCSGPYWTDSATYSANPVSDQSTGNRTGSNTGAYIMSVICGEQPPYGTWEVVVSYPTNGYFLGSTSSGTFQC
jgi:hypothetical protein